MAVPFAGEIRLMASDRLPDEWASCEGQQLFKGAAFPLFLVMGQTFGGDGMDQFVLPDLRGRVPLQMAPAHPLAQAGGAEAVTLTVAQLPGHTHDLRARDSDGTQAEPTGNVWARSEARGFAGGSPDGGMHAATLGAAGSGQAHDNLMPFLGVKSIISLNGRFPDDPDVQDVYAGEIRLFASDHVPEGWVRCDGQLLPISENFLLFALIGTKYGGSGDKFAVPDLSGRVPIHRGSGRSVGEPGGEESHTLVTGELPAHAHAPRAAGTAGDDPSPIGRTWGVQTAGLAYSDAQPDVSLSAEAISSTGGGGAHENMPPFLALHFCISLRGEDPTVEDAMSIQPFSGEIRMFPYELAPMGWAFCDGSILNVRDNVVLSAMLGATYGGDGRNTFALPDLRGRAPLHAGQGPGLMARALGEAGGAETVTLLDAHMPAHTHEVRVRSAAGEGATPSGQVFATVPARALSAGYSSQEPSVSMSPLAVTATEGGLPHNNMPPYLPLAFCISLFGDPF
jgi:microcystin-dependent protein